jgi:beta-glucosidase
MGSRISLLTAAALATSSVTALAVDDGGRAPPVLESRTSVLLHQDGLEFKDLDHNGVLDPYEDWRLDARTRAHDLVSRMSLEEKAGTMMHGTAPSLGKAPVPGAGARWDMAAFTALIKDVGVNSFLSRLSGDPAELARQYDLAQAVAESTRLGIPLTISSDPRNGFQYQQGASVAAGSFSQWPDPPGLAAIGDAALVRRHADIARQEYRAIGIRMALSPQADLATEPRWARIKGTFGENPEKARELVRAYIEGFQGVDGLGADSVAAIVKHWVGYGASVDGLDGHNHYGRFTNLTSASMEAHLVPFEGAFAAQVAGVMPTYAEPPAGLRVSGVDGALEQVGAGFSRQMLTQLLRGRFHYDGLILTDWAIMDDCDAVCMNGAAPGALATPADIAMPWGVETLSKSERYTKALDAGVDQFGGIEDPATLIALVRTGRVPQARLDASVQRILELKFRLGLFENPYVDPGRAAQIVGNPGFAAEALAAQARSFVTLKNAQGLLPIAQKGRRVFLYHVDPEAARRAGFVVVDDLHDADLAILRISTPFERLHPNYFFGARYNEGSLAFADGNPDYEAVKAAAAQVPTVVSVYLDRGAILTNIADKATALVANFGASDQAMFDVLTGRRRAEGHLPFELPSSMAEVAAQRPDLPHDTAHPLYPVGFSLMPD